MLRQHKRRFRGRVLGRTRAVGHDSVGAGLLHECSGVTLDLQQRCVHRASDVPEVERRRAPHVDHQDFAGRMERTELLLRNPADGVKVRRGGPLRSGHC